MILTTLVLLTLPQAATTQTAPASTPRTLSSFHWFDLDRDGDLDALAIEPGGTLRVLHNRGEGRFLDGTTASGLGAVQDARAALLGDVDLDEAPDLVLSTGAGLRLFRQAGLSFVEDTPERFASLGPVEGIDWVDANGDQRPDLHLSAAGVHRVFANEASGFRELDLGLLASATEPAAPSVRSDGGAEARERKPERPAPAIVTGPRAATGGTGAQTSFAAVGGGAGSTVTPSGSLPSAAPAAAVCSSGVLDQAGTGCLPASTEPTLGMLYPLGNEFMIDAVTGNVGIGTTTPGYALEVSGQIVGGTNNTASGAQSSIVGGESNSATGLGAFVGGGVSNLALSDRAAIAGGVGNRAAYRSFVGGGDNNAATGNITAIAGGKQNEANQTGASVGGGEQNLSSGTHAAVGGGFGNAASANNATVGGGLSNAATGAYGTIPGGRQNVAAGAYTHAAGRRARAVHDGAFVWADSTDADFSSTGPDQFLVRAAGGMGVGRVPDPSFQVDVEGAVRASDTIVSTKPTGGPISVVSTDVSPNLNADLLDGFHASAFSQLGSQIETPELADDAVTAAKIAAAAVGTSELANDAVTASQIAADAVDESHLQAASVGSTELQVSAVQSVNLAAGAVLSASIGEGEVTLSKLDVSGGTSGQFLMHSGTAASWATMPTSDWIPITALPLTITTPGVYYLTEDLVGVSGANGITVSVSDVIINLNGHTLQGAPGSFNGIQATVDRVTVVGGVIRDWDTNGVSADSYLTARDVHFLDNGFRGLSCEDGALVVSCRATGNGDTGIWVRRGLVRECISEFNATRGIYAQDDSAIHGCSSRGNGTDGFIAVNSTIESCTAHANTQTGVSLFGGGTVSQTSSSFNGSHGFYLQAKAVHCSAVSNSGNGFEVQSGGVQSSYCEGNQWGIFASYALIKDNTAFGNVLGGIAAAGPNSCVDSNHVSGSLVGIATGGSPGNVVIKNTVTNCSQGYDITSGNLAAQILSPSSGFSSSNAWANLVF